MTGDFNSDGEGLCGIGRLFSCKPDVVGTVRITILNNSIQHTIIEIDSIIVCPYPAISAYIVRILNQNFIFITRYITHFDAVDLVCFELECVVIYRDHRFFGLANRDVEFL